MVIKAHFEAGVKRRLVGKDTVDEYGHEELLFYVIIAAAAYLAGMVCLMIINCRNEQVE